MSMLSQYLESAHDVEVEGMNIEAGTLQLRIQSRGVGQAFLQLTSWQIIQDLAQLLQSLGPNTELLLDIIGTDEYAVDLLVLSKGGMLGFRSETNRDTFIAIQQRSISYQHWEFLAKGYFEGF
jgi:hypothetical protein